MMTFMGHVHPVPSSPGAGEWFATTHWSVVLLAAGNSEPNSREALETLCASYWYPLYAYVRRAGRTVEDAQDLTQEFFARLLEKQYLGLATPERGRFRTFLLSSLKNFLANDWKRAHRQKRGGDVPTVSIDTALGENRYVAEPVDTADPEKLYEKRWATTLLDLTLDRLRRDYAVAGRAPLFEELKIFVWGERSDASYAAIAQHLGLTEGAVKVAVHRLRHRFRELLRAQIANTVADERELDEELRHLIAVIGS
jgi:RNA polymerase sigma factor (sigma-70 family)